MEQVKRKQISRGMERIFLLFISILFAFIFFKLFTVLKKDFEEVPKRLGDGSMINLNDPDPGAQMKLLLQRGFYFEDPKDIELISSIIGQRLNTRDERIDNIGELNKRKYDVEADQASMLGGESFNKRVRLAGASLGYSDADAIRFLQVRKAAPPLPAVHK